MTDAFICDAIRTPIGRYGGSLSAVRADDLGAVPLKALMARNPQVDWSAICRSSAAAAPSATLMRFATRSGSALRPHAGNRQRRSQPDGTPNHRHP